MSAARAVQSRRTSGPTASPPATNGSHLDLVPVDPHRVFAHWQLSPAALARLQEMAAPHPADARLTLRVFRLPDQHSSLLQATGVEDFPAAATQHEGFYSVREPGGCVAAVLGIKNAQNRFTPAVTSVHVTLPEAPRPAGPPPPAPTAPVLPTPRPGTATPALDETSVLRAAGPIASLPAELRTLPGITAVTKMLREPAATPALPPETPALDERAVVAAALRAFVPESVSKSPASPDAKRKAGKSRAAGVTEPEFPAAPTDDETTPAGSSRLASMVGSETSGAPISIRATLIVSGRVAPGQRLRIGDRELPIHPGGAFSHQQRIDGFNVVWPLLLRTMAQANEPAAPSLELLGRLPDAGALLAMSASLEIEGQIQDPSYRAHLPPEVGVDAAGRFRLVRTLPAGALLLPHLVLLAANFSE